MSIDDTKPGGQPPRSSSDLLSLVLKIIPRLDAGQLLYLRGAISFQYNRHQPPHLQQDKLSAYWGDVFKDEIESLDRKWDVSRHPVIIEINEVQAEAVNGSQINQTA